MKKLVLFVWIIFSFLPMEAEMLSERIPGGTRNMLALRIQFLEDNSYLTTGNGHFMLTEWTGHDTTYILDPLPHDRAYFSSHLTFIDNYWNKASNGRIRFGTDPSYNIPLTDTPYTLSNQMRYYSDPDSLDYRLANMIHETVMLAVDNGEFQSDNDGLIIYHAGAGQDFKIDLDDSPFDIPSFFFDDSYLSEYLSSDKYNDLVTLNAVKGVVLPESQNQLSVNIALNGTEILLTGLLLGLPTLYDTEFGRSGAGTYGLMDQGSNTASGLCPIKPSAFERYLLGAADPVELIHSQNVTLFQDEVYKLSISSNEYFLVEFRKNTGFWADSLMWERNDIDDYLDLLHAMDSLDLIDYTFENGVLTDISDLDFGLPKSGILIWHIVEPIPLGDNPNAQDNWFLNLVEADGGDDIGKWYNTFDPTVNNGWKWDTWFPLNEGYRQNNPSAYKMQFNNNTHPNTRSKENLPTGIAINDFKFYADSVVIQLHMDTPALHTIDGMVFDEMTTAFDDVLPGIKQLIGYRDSSLYMFDGQILFDIYKNDTPYTKGNVALISYENSLIQIVNGSQSKISHLVNAGGLLALAEDNSFVTNPVDLEHIAILGDTLFLPPLAATGIDSSNSMPVQKIHLPDFTGVTVDEGTGIFIPYVKNGKLDYIEADAAALMNGELVYSDTYGFQLEKASEDFLPEDYMPVYPDRHELTDIVPLHMDTDGEYEVLVLSDFDGRKTLSAFSHNGPLLNHYPIFGDYTELRVYELGGSPKIVAYDPAGIIDIYGADAVKDMSFPAPVDAASFFIEQMTADTAWIVADGSIYPVASQSVYWGYNGRDAAHSNAQSATQTAVPVTSDNLIKDGAVYNYPNPIEGERTKFRFFATGATHVTISIYALDGRFIRTIEEDVTDQQWNEVPWYVFNEVSGVYIAKIEFTDGTKTETYFIKPAILK